MKREKKRFQSILYKVHLYWKYMQLRVISTEYKSTQSNPAVYRMELLKQLKQPTKLMINSVHDYM